MSTSSGDGPEKATDFLLLLDEIDALIPDLEAIGVNIQPEMGRWDGVKGSVQRYANDLPRELKPSADWQKSGMTNPKMPPQEHWWWWLDVASQRARRQTYPQERHLDRRHRHCRDWLAPGSSKHYFPVDPKVQESYRLQIAAERLMLDGGDPDLILQNLEEAAALTPGQMDIQSLLVVLYEEQGNLDRADTIRQQLFDAFSESDVYAQLAQTYYERNDYAKAVAFARKAIEVDPDNVMAYMTAGLTSEAMGDRRAAVGYLTEASEIAARIDDAELQAIARIQLAQIMQSPPRSLGPHTPSP